MRSRVVLPLLLLVTAGPTTVALAQSPGTFTATGKMTVPRSGHTATLLTNGKILVAGGYSDSGVVASAELYDPSTGVYTPTGDMITARSGHSAALLPDGKVLITQGTYWPSSYAELYDPATGTFTITGGTTMVSGIVTLLKNGKVLITGNTAQLYDPITNSFAPTGSYVGPFYNGPFFWPDTATLLQDGRVLIVGNAAGDGNGYIEHEELYDPVTGVFKVTGKPHTFGFGSDIWSVHTATLLPNGKVLLAGGVSEDFGYFSIAELYDPSTDTFSATGNMTIARAGHTATLLTDGTVLAAGGQLYSSLISAELYNPATGAFSSTGSMTIARVDHSATLLFDGRVLISGGAWGGGVLASDEIYTPAVLAPAPVLFSLSGDGRGQGAIWRSATGQITSSANPATAGDVLSMYTTSLFEGGAIPPQVAVGSQLAEILFFGDAPGYPGYYQVNFRVPSGIAPGLAVSVRLTYLGRQSNEVTIGVR
ncbi:MAG TPA: kelch repeat-containing protein [Terriglobales bacterium]|nr:kelch repeat-containing protein [Terriglobales bacterium]